MGRFGLRRCRLILAGNSPCHGTGLSMSPRPMGLASAAVLILALGAGAVRPPDHTGFAVMYAPHVMEARAKAHHAPPAPCYVAYTMAHDADMARLWLRVQGPAG